MRLGTAHEQRSTGRGIDRQDGDIGFIEGPGEHLRRVPGVVASAGWKQNAAAPKDL